MDAAGIDIHVVSPVQCLYHYWLPAELAADLACVVNDGIAEMVAAAPRRLVGMATVPLQDSDATLRELDRVHSLGFRAVEIGTHIAGVGLDERALDSFYARAETLGMVIFVHPYAPLGRDRLGAYFLRNLLGNPFETTIAMSQVVFGGVLDRFPGLRLAFAHGGGAVPYVIGRLERGYAVEPECRAAGGRSPVTHLRRVYYDTITHDAQALQYLVGRVGASQILMGSDWPFSIGDLDPVATVDKLDLEPAARAAILGGNAAALLEVPA
jgi:aminocarboxymuconate-semialdehyde decarboxylase